MDENTKLKVSNITATYDLKREFLPILFPNEENTNITPLELMFEYKIKANGLKIDSDVSEVAMYVYRTCYETLVNAEVHLQNNSRLTTEKEK